LPKELNTKEKIAVLIMKAKELNMPALEAISHLYVVNQKVAIDSSGMLALILRSGLAKKIHFGGDGTSAWCEMERKDGVISFKYTFTIEDAKRAGLLSKESWQKYTKELLVARAISGCARKVFPDVVGGLYTVEELGGEEVPELPIELVSEAEETTESAGVVEAEVSAAEQTGEEAVVVFEPEKEEVPLVTEEKKVEKKKQETVEVKKEEKPKETKEVKKEEKKVEKPVSASQRLAKILSIVEKYSSDTIEQQTLVVNVKKKLGLKQKVADLSEEDFSRLISEVEAEVEKRLGENI
jgi:DNA-binding protein Fis